MPDTVSNGTMSSQNQRTPTAYLRIERGIATHRVRPIHDPVFLIGSSLDCDLVLASSDVAPILCYLIVDDHHAVIHVVDRDAGVLLNGAPVTRANLADGDVLCVSGYEFQLSTVTKRPVAQDLRLLQPLKLFGSQQRSEASGGIRTHEQRSTA